MVLRRLEADLVGACSDDTVLWLQADSNQVEWSTPLLFGSFCNSCHLGGLSEF